MTSDDRTRDRGDDSRAWTMDEIRRLLAWSNPILPFDSRSDDSLWSGVSYDKGGKFFVKSDHTANRIARETAESFVTHQRRICVLDEMRSTHWPKSEH